MSYVPLSRESFLRTEDLRYGRASTRVVFRNRGIGPWGPSRLEGDHGVVAMGRVLIACVVVLASGALAPVPAYAGTACTAAQPESIDVPMSIPSPPAVAESTLTIPESGPINDLDVNLSLTHPFDSDLTIELVPPSASAVTLAEGVGTWGDDFADTTFDDEATSSIVSALPPFSGDFRPTEPLSALDGVSRTGTWRLRVTDRHSGYDGTIASWGLAITCPDIAPPTGQAITAPRRLFQRSASFGVGWAGGSGGVASRDVDYFRATTQGGFGPPVHFRDHTMATSGRFANGIPGSTYCFTERLRDGAGNESSFSSLRCAAIPLDDPQLAASGGWRRRNGSGYYLGNYSQSRRKGATLTSPEVTGDRYAVIATRCPHCGTLKAFLNGNFLKRVRLTANREKKRQVISLANFAELQTGELELKVVSEDKRVIVEGLGVARRAIPALPEVWEEAGAPQPPPLPSGVPTGTEETIGTLITVTTDSDVADGDTSSVANLTSTPGADGGISLREAITAANNDPGAETIRFTAAMAGMTVSVGSSLPPLEDDAGVFINGDIDDNGDPDVTIEDGANGMFGLLSFASNNRLHALAIEGFANANVLMRPDFSATGETLTNNTISGLVLSESEIAVVQSGGDTGNHWIDTRMVGNSIQTEFSGIDLRLHGSTGETIDRATVAGNAITIDPDASHELGFGVAVASGLGSDSDDNRISDVLVAHNLIEGTPEGAVFLNASGSGNVPGVGSVLEDVTVINNRASLEPIDKATGSFGTSGISVYSGDDFFVGADDNITRRIEVSGNVIDGYGRSGINVTAGLVNSTTEDVTVTDNVIHGIVSSQNFSGPDGIVNKGVYISGGGSSDNEVRDVVVRRNTLTTDNPESIETAPLVTGGVIVEAGGGGGPPGGDAENVTIADNVIDTEQLAVNLIGGFAYAESTEDNHVSRIRVLRNLIVREPVLATAYQPGIKTLGLIGGAGPTFGSWSATGNSISCVSIEDNIVVGVLDDFSLRQNVGSGAANNTATLGGC